MRPLQLVKVIFSLKGRKRKGKDHQNAAATAFVPFTFLIAATRQVRPEQIVEAEKEKEKGRT